MNSLKQFLKKIVHIVKAELKDPYTFVVFLAVLIVMYSPAWGGYLLYFFIKQAWLLALASAYVAFWAGPFTPFFPLCLALTLWIRRVIFKAEERKEKNDKK